MKRVVLILALLIMVLVGATYINTYIHIRGQETLNVGFARVNISPVDDNGDIISVPLGGYAGLRICDSIESDIFATCTAFEDKNGNRALVYSIDSIGISAEVTDKALTAIYEKNKVPRENIILNCTHNHTSPETSSEIEESEIYTDLLVEALVKAGKTAISDLSACTKLKVGEISLSKFSYIRRPDDKTSVDAEVPVARFYRKNKNDVLLVNWAAHCDTISSMLNLSCSADYVGAFRDYLEDKLDVSVSLQMGACADVSPVLNSKNTKDKYRKDFYGEDLAKAVIMGLGKLKTTKIISDIDSAVITLGAAINHADDDMFEKASEVHILYYSNKPEEYKKKCEEYGIENVYEAVSIVHRYKGGEYDDITIGTIGIGNIGFAWAPYEMFAKNGAEIKEKSPFDLTFVMGYSNGREGYMAADYAYDVGGYEVYSCEYARGTAEQLQNQLIAMLNDIYNDTNCHHQFKAYQTDGEHHWTYCDKCNEKFANPTKHLFNDIGICTICDIEHEHQWNDFTGFSGMTFSALGSSTTMGAGIKSSYVDEVAEILGLKKTYNYGVSWSTLGYKENCTCNHPYLPDDYNHDPMVFRYDDMYSADIICVCGGLNDFGVDLPLGDINDTEVTTFYGALNVLLDSLKKTYPDSYIFMMTGFNYYDGYTNDNGDTWASFNAAMVESCEKNGIDCLDLYTDFPFNYLYDTYDYVHMTQEFTSDVWAPAIANFIKENYHPNYYYNGCTLCDRKERVEYQNLFVDTVENHGKVCTYDLETKHFIEKESERYSYTLINVESLNGLRFEFSEKSPSVAWSYFFYDENDINVGGGNLTVGLTDVYVSVPESAVYVGVLYNPNNLYGVYGAP